MGLALLLLVPGGCGGHGGRFPTRPSAEKFVRSSFVRYCHRRVDRVRCVRTPEGWNCSYRGAGVAGTMLLKAPGGGHPEVQVIC